MEDTIHQFFSQESSSDSDVVPSLSFPGRRSIGLWSSVSDKTLPNKMEVCNLFSTSVARTTASVAHLLGLLERFKVIEKVWKPPLAAPSSVELRRPANLSVDMGELAHFKEVHKVVLPSFNK